MTCRSKWPACGNIFFNASSTLINSSAKRLELKKNKAQLKLKRILPILESHGNRRNKPIIVSRFKSLILSMVNLILKFDHEILQWTIIKTDRISILFISAAADRVAVIADSRPIISPH